MEANKIFQQTVLNAQIKCLNNIIESFHFIDCGQNESVDGIFIIKNIRPEENILKELFAANVLYENVAINRITKKFEELSAKSKEKMITFTASMNYNTDYIKVFSKGNTVCSFRNYGYFRIALIDKKNRNFFEDVQLDSTVDSIILQIDNLYSQLINEIELSNEEENNIFQMETKVVFSPKAASFLIHEILGHMLECDNVHKGISIFAKSKIGDKIANEQMTLIDNPAKNIDKTINTIDDDGRDIESVTLIKNGILMNFIGSDVNNEPNGFNRSTSYRYKSLPRMRYTYLESSKSILTSEQIIKTTNNGIWIEKIDSGLVGGPNGQFYLNCPLCSFIKDGVKLKSIYGVGIHGNSHDVICDIELIGSDFQKSFGLCYKGGQLIPVEMGAPTLMVKKLLVKKGEINV